MDEDYYRILGVSEDAEPEVIEAAFKAMAKKYHPDIWKGDKSFATEKLKKLNEARDILRNSEKRAAYDQEKNKDAKTSSTNNEKPNTDNEGTWNNSGTENSYQTTSSRQQASDTKTIDKRRWIKLCKENLTSTWVILLLFFILVGISAFSQNWSVPFIDILIGLALILILIKKILYDRSRFWIILLFLIIFAAGVQFSISLFNGINLEKNKVLTEQERKTAISDIIEEQVNEVANSSSNLSRKETNLEPPSVTSYFEFPGTFTTNLRSSRKFLQLGLGLSTQYDDTVMANIETHQLALRPEILNVMSEFTEDDIQGKAGREALAKALVARINEKMLKLEGFGGVEAAHFTSFVLQ